MLPQWKTSISVEMQGTQGCCSYISHVIAFYPFLYQRAVTGGVTTLQTFSRVAAFFYLATYMSEQNRAWHAICYHSLSWLFEDQPHHNYQRHERGWPHKR